MQKRKIMPCLVNCLLSRRGGGEASLLRNLSALMRAQGSGGRAERAFSVHDLTPPRSNTGHSCGRISTYPHQTFGERGVGGGVQY
jgi:hypothetical protein